MLTPDEKIAIWSMRAADYRVAAKAATHSETRETYLTLAASYEKLVEREREMYAAATRAADKVRAS